MEREYEAIMNEMYLLKKHLNMSLIEQAITTAEDRKWLIKRIQKDIEDQREAARNTKH